MLTTASPPTPIPISIITLKMASAHAPTPVSPDDSTCVQAMSFLRPLHHYRFHPTNDITSAQLINCTFYACLNLPCPTNAASPTQRIPSSATN
mmetsp:Transcript_42527/g.89262  ORF Transcript_42527/g.89262 Transcript_42527/m.89262 type:complete len:93 (+) Transcript_42527:176-454(+)